MKKPDPTPITTQGQGWRGQRFYAFILTALIANGTLYMATNISAPIELAKDVIYMECLVGIVLVLGRTGVHLAEAWAASKIGTTQQRTSTTVIKTEKEDHA